MKTIMIQKETKPKCSENPDEIVAVSCVNLRNDDGSWRDVGQDKIMLCCTICGKKKQLGKHTATVVRIEFRSTVEIFCDRCMDVFTEIGVYGPQVIGAAYKWELSSQVTRVAAIHEHMKCFRCSKKSQGHLYVKYYDVTRTQEKVGRQKPLHFLKVCGVCTSEMLLWMIESKIMVSGNKFPLSKVQKTASPVRRWVQ